MKKESIQLKEKKRKQIQRAIAALQKIDLQIYNEKLKFIDRCIRDLEYLLKEMDRTLTEFEQIVVELYTSGNKPMLKKCYTLAVKVYRMRGRDNEIPSYESIRETISRIENPGRSNPANDGESR